MTKGPFPGYDGNSLGCPSCKSQRLVTVSTRAHKAVVRRRRECVPCKHRFSTEESILIRDRSMIRLILDKSGRLVAVEDGRQRGVVRPDLMSTKRFAKGVSSEFPELSVEVK